MLSSDTTPEPKLLTVLQYAAAHGISDTCVYDRIKAGRLVAIKNPNKRGTFVLDGAPVPARLEAAA
jgi:hypothetical protein